MQRSFGFCSSSSAKNSCSLLSHVSSIIYRPSIGYSVNIVRFAGGGGRPGGRPTFNWREKQQLRLSNKDAQKEMKLRPFGSWLDLEPYFNEKEGDKMIDPKKVPSYTVEASDAATENTRKTLHYASLFGSTKSYGFLRDKVKHGHHARFSHKRIFGVAKEKANIKS